MSLDPARKGNGHGRLQDQRRLLRLRLRLEADVNTTASEYGGKVQNFCDEYVVVSAGGEEIARREVL